MSKMVALDKNRHRNYRIEQGDLGHSAGQQSCPALMGEFAQLAAEYPIVFVRSGDGDELRSIAMLGIKPGKNLFWQNNQWQGAYVPAALRAHPFATAGIGGQGDQFAICLDESSSRVMSSGVAGEPLFDNKGEQTEYLANISCFLAELRTQVSLSNDFVRYLNENALLEEQVVLVNLPGGVDHRLTGVFRVSEKALNGLSDGDFLALRKRGYLPAIYTHLNSLRQVNNLSRLYSQLRKEGLH